MGQRISYCRRSSVQIVAANSWWAPLINSVVSKTSAPPYLVFTVWGLQCRLWMSWWIWRTLAYWNRPVKASWNSMCFRCSSSRLACRPTWVSMPEAVAHTHWNLACSSSQPWPTSSTALPWGSSRWHCWHHMGYSKAHSCYIYSDCQSTS